MNYEPKKEIAEKLLRSFNEKLYFDVVKKISELRIEYPNSIFLLNVLGVTYNELNKYDEAIKCFNDLLKINKNFADAYFNLGIIYKKIKEEKKSIFNYNQCIKINPKKFEAYNNLGNIYKERQEIKIAIEKYLQCLEINPNYIIALQNFAVCLQNFKFNKTSSIVDRHIINLLEQKKLVRPVDIIFTIIDYLYLNPKLKLILKNIDNLENNLTLNELIMEISNIKILILLIENTPITDLKIEKILRYLRSEILLNLSTLESRKVALKLMKSIAKQCFINEYIYSFGKKEEGILNNIEKKIIKDLQKNSFTQNDLEIACLAAYMPLHILKWSNKIKQIPNLKDLIQQQINEPQEELNLRKKLLSLNIKNKISLNVKNQYENNPYPRWNKVALYGIPKKPLIFFKNLELNINEENIQKWENIDVLVAGCGTGQHAITTATKYENSFVTAIDLSAQSLCYAKRKADEFEIKNIEFIQMDLLDLKKISKKFDIIESVGVLHHMDNPFTGWQILNEFLNPNGLMMIGLYSKIAREHISKIRNEIKKDKININEKNIIKYREEIISSKNFNFHLIKQSTDFFSLSTLRDLLFHVQEHTFTISQIIKHLNHLKLTFSGFENRSIINLFKNKHNDKKDLYNLNLWKKFEIDNPRIFAGMYQFWCQKKL